MGCESYNYDSLDRFDGGTGLKTQLNSPHLNYFFHAHIYTTLQSTNAYSHYTDLNFNSPSQVMFITCSLIDLRALGFSLRSCHTLMTQVAFLLNTTSFFSCTPYPLLFLHALPPFPTRLLLMHLHLHWLLCEPSASAVYFPRLFVSHQYMRNSSPILIKDSGHRVHAIRSSLLTVVQHQTNCISLNGAHP